MKAYRKDPDFKPVVIEIESEDELRYLWHCLGCSKSVIKPDTDKHVPFPYRVNDLQMFSEIDRLLNPTKL